MLYLVGVCYCNEVFQFRSPALIAVHLIVSESRDPLRPAVCTLPWNTAHSLRRYIHIIFLGGAGFPTCWYLHFIFN